VLESIGWQCSLLGCPDDSEIVEFAISVEVQTFYQFPGFNFRKSEEQCRYLAPVLELLVMSLVENAARLMPSQYCRRDTFRA